MAKPDRIRLRSYNVGFGDCYLLSFHYDLRPRMRTRHVLIDFGSTKHPKKNKKTKNLMQAIARDIRAVCAQGLSDPSRARLDVLVATHRHADHISGFAGSTGALLKTLNPKVVVQPWTEDPQARPNATRPTRRRAGLARRALDRMHDVAYAVFREAGSRRSSLPAHLRGELAFLGEENIKNRKAVEWLMSLKGKKRYAYYGSSLGLARVLPGVRVRVLGPPTLEQSDAIARQRSEDKDEFWHLQSLTRVVQKPGQGRLFPQARVKRTLPPEIKWFKERLDRLRGDQLLEIVRELDEEMNNTSLILLFEAGNEKLLFPGDAQIENWSYALTGAKNRAQVKKALSNVNVYKVGHHGSLNATPKSLWNLFDNKGGAGTAHRLQTFLSTLAGKHGREESETEVPRRPLVEALKANSSCFSTQDLAIGEFFRDFEFKVGGT